MTGRNGLRGEMAVKAPIESDSESAQLADTRADTMTGVAAAAAGIVADTMTAATWDERAAL